MAVEVKYNDYRGRHTLYVVEGKGPALMGRDWLSQIRLDWASIRVISSDSKPDIDKLINKYSEVFQPGLETMEGVRAHLSLKSIARPRFWRPVLFLLLSKTRWDRNYIDRRKLECFKE